MLRQRERSKQCGGIALRRVPIVNSGFWVGGLGHTTCSGAAILAVLGTSASGMVRQPRPHTAEKAPICAWRASQLAAIARGVGSFVFVMRSGCLRCYVALTCTKSRTRGVQAPSDI